MDDGIQIEECDQERLIDRPDAEGERMVGDEGAGRAHVDQQGQQDAREPCRRQRRSMARRRDSRIMVVQGTEPPAGTQRGRSTRFFVRQRAGQECLRDPGPATARIGPYHGCRAVWGRCMHSAPRFSVGDLEYFDTMPYLDERSIRPDGEIGRRASFRS